MERCACMSGGLSHAKRRMMLRTSTKPNRCQHCKERMTDDKARHVLHDECITPWLDALNAKRALKQKAALLKAKRVEKAIDRKQREKLKTHAQWQAEAQAAVNAFVRQRDHLLPCISCGRMHEGQWHAGHYRSRGAAPHLALNPKNIFKQCQPCNVHLHGNLIAYRLGFIARAGLAAVEAIEADNTPRHHSIDDLREIKTKYAALTKQLKREMG